MSKPVGVVLVVAVVEALAWEIVKNILKIVRKRER